jgi:hypothetical protein
MERSPRWGLKTMAHSALQCIAAHRDLGFEIKDTDARTVVLQHRDGRCVCVTRHATLWATEVHAISVAAAITRGAFARAVAKRGSGSWTNEAMDGPQ